MLLHYQTTCSTSHVCHPVYSGYRRPHLPHHSLLQSTTVHDWWSKDELSSSESRGLPCCTCHWPKWVWVCTQMCVTAVASAVNFESYLYSYIDHESYMCILPVILYDAWSQYHTGTDLHYVCTLLVNAEVTHQPSTTVMVSISVGSVHYIHSSHPTLTTFVTRHHGITRVLQCACGVSVYEDTCRIQWMNHAVSMQHVLQERHTCSWSQSNVNSSQHSFWSAYIHCWMHV